MVKSVLFDFDGTIVNSLPAILHSWKTALHVQGLDLSDLEVVRYVFYTTQSEREARFRLDADKAEHEHQALLAPLRAGYSLQEGIEEVLAGLKKRGVTMAVVTSTHSEAVRRVLKEHQVDDYFEIVLGRDSLPLGKPHPEIVYKALEHLGVSKNEAIMVGDSPIDIETAQNAGIPIALYASTNNDPYRDNDRLRQLHPDYRFERWGDFISTLAGLLRPER